MSTNMVALLGLMSIIGITPTSANDWGYNVGIGPSENDAMGAIGGYYPSLPATQSSTLHPYQPGLSKSFVTAKGGKLYLDGLDYSFATFNYPGLIGMDDFQVSRSPRPRRSR
jgi:hypothetical protein